MTVADIKNTEFDSYYDLYLHKVSNKLELTEGFKIGEKNVIQFFETIPKNKLEYRYQQKKWTIKEVFQHMIDTERIFMYRCFRIARNDKTPLTGYDQNIYIEPSKANQKSIDELLSEFKAVRQNSISLLNSLNNEDLLNIGLSNDAPMSARAAAFTIIGHDIWHMDVIKEKYL